MNYIRNAISAIALSQSKILEIAYLVQADVGQDWKEGRVIRKPDGTFLKWKPSGSSIIPGRKGDGKLEKVKSTQDIEESSGKSEDELSYALDKQADRADELLDAASRKISAYRSAMNIAKDSKAREKLDEELRATIKDVAQKISKELTSDENYVKALEKQVRRDANQERVMAFNSALNKLAGGERIRQAPGNIAKSALKEGTTGAKALASPEGRVAAATAGVVAMGVLVAALNKKKALNLLLKQVEKAGAKKYTRDVAERMGADVKDVGIVTKTLEKAEDSVPIVGAMLRSHRKEKAVELSKNLGKEARGKAEDALTAMKETEIDKAWEDVDDLFADVPDSVRGSGIIDTLSNIVSKPGSEMRNLKLSSGQRGVIAAPILSVAMNSAGLGDDTIFDDLMNMLSDGGFKLSAEDIQDASDMLRDPKVMKRIADELVNSMGKF
jgi:hypothetical protein